MLHLKNLTKGEIIFGENQNYKIARIFRELEDEDTTGKNLYIELTPYNEPIAMPDEDEFNMPLSKV